MDKIKLEVAKARRRLSFQAFMSILPWVMLVCFSACFVGLLLPKIRYVPYTFETWSRVWLLTASLGTALLTFVFAMLRRPSLRAAAIEIDKRYGLQERLSSALGLSEAERSSFAGLAVTKDAEAKLDRIDLRDRFPVQLSKYLPWGILPVLGCIGLFWVPDADSQSVLASSLEAQERLTQVKQQTKPLLQQVKQLRDELDQQGFGEASDELKRLEKKLNELQAKKELNPKELMSDFNAIKKEILERKESMRSRDEMQKAMARLEELGKGPGEQMAKAMKNGDIEAANDELRSLRDKLKNGQLTEEERHKLADQLKQMEQALKDQLEEQQGALEQLRNELEKAEASGDIEQAARIRQQMEKLENAIQKSKSNSQVASKLAKAAESLRKGDSSAAEEALSEMEDALQRMEAGEETAEELERLMDDLQKAKQASTCQECSGKGCEDCQGTAKNRDSESSGEGAGKDGSMSKGKGKRSAASKLSRTRAVAGAGKGPGRGTGSGSAAPADEIETQSYDARVEGDRQAGEKTFGGKARGTNRPGISMEEARDAIRSATPEDPDASEGIPLPRAQREQQREYFDKLRAK